VIPLPSPAILRATAIAVALAVSAAGGWKMRGWKEDAARLDAERTTHATYVATVDGWAAAMQVIHGLRAADQEQAATDRTEYQRRLKHATRPQSEPLVVCGPGLDAGRTAAGAVPVRFSADFVGLWDSALDIGLPATLRANRDHRPRPAASLSAAR